MPLLLVGVGRVHEDVSDSILAFLREGRHQKTLRLCSEEFVRDGGHHACAVAVARIGAGSASMSHCTEKMTSIGDDLVGVNALNVTDKAYATGIPLVFIVVKTLGGGQGVSPRLCIVLDVWKRLHAQRKGDVVGVQEAERPSANVNGWPLGDSIAGDPIG